MTSSFRVRPSCNVLSLSAADTVLKTSGLPSSPSRGTKRRGCESVTDKSWVKIRDEAPSCLQKT
jgi:hypothetical protein